MSPYYQGRKMPFNNPIANALVVLVGALAVGASIVLGFIAFVALASLLVVLAAILGIRIWWFNRKLRRQGRAGRPASTPGVEPVAEVIEGEFRVLRSDAEQRRDREE